ncbi:MAG: tRNA adenosine(34) deaminase TadA [Gammaproteobacteria bacterium]|nr:tRNA adenosine(34) deaminase TadA [Gammaproteobacteria bacterium]
MNPSNDEKWLAQAIAAAEKAQNIGEVPVGAVLVDENNECIAVAHNQPITTHNATAHAEIEVLKKAGQVMKNYRLPNTTLYVTLEPCPMCTGAIIHARVARVVFAAKDFRTGSCGTVFDLHNSSDLNHRFQADFIECEDYIHMLKDFFRARRKKS